MHNLLRLLINLIIFLLLCSHCKQGFLWRYATYRHLLFQVKKIN